MPLVLDYAETLALYRRCGDAGLTMARIGYSDQDQIFGIIRGAARFAREHDIRVLPIGIFSTVGHYIFQQLPRYLTADHRLPSEGGDPSEYRRRLYRNARLATSFMETVTEEGDPDHGHVHIIHHYDPGHHTLPGGKLSRNELLRDFEFIDLFSSVMFDDTHSPFEENVAHSIDYRKLLHSSGRKKVLEGCLEEVAAGGQGKESSAFTDPGQIEHYLEKTGFELVVPNIGSESIHARQVGIEWSVLEELHRRGVGSRLVVHGFSSIRKLPVDEQRRLGKLGVVGMNAWSYIPQHIGPRLLERAARILKLHDEEKGHPVDFDAGEPVYRPSTDANVFFGPLLDQVRDLKVELIADSVHEILGNLGTAEKLGTVT
ncbi:MAG: class II fructose-bisphosphate aldolase [Planctomycetota bacterium]|nr:class II fructose-bisphosphate aldolase [Planctomycetota bacterium]